MIDRVEKKPAPGAHKREISIYVHVPFCQSKCAYCNFFSLPGRDDDFDPYIEALATEWRTVLGDEGLSAETDLVTSVFIGGGTPSLLGGERLKHLLSSLRIGPVWSDDCEISIEVNPESMDEALARSVLASGFNRISIGAQSFKDADLEGLGRRATRKQIVDSIKAVRTAGCTNLSLDLIFGLPGQTLDDWMSVLGEALSHKTEHLSCYLLTPEEDTVLYRLLRGGEIATPLEETLFNQYIATGEMVTSTGFEQYEISNYARPGCRCLHNEGTWQRRPYYGLGPAAHSFSGEVRWRNSPDLDLYLSQLLDKRNRLVKERYRLDKLDVAKELIMVCMRRSEGVLWTQIEQVVSNAVMQQIKQRARFLSGTGFLLLDKYGMRLNPKAYFVSNSVFVELMRSLEEDSS